MRQPQVLGNQPVFAPFGAWVYNRNLHFRRTTADHDEFDGSLAELPAPGRAGGAAAAGRALRVSAQDKRMGQAS